MGRLPEKAKAQTQFLEMTLPENSKVIGKTIAELSIPRTAVLVSIQHGDEIIIPRGDTMMHVGDVVTTLCERDTIDAVKILFLSPDGPIENDARKAGDLDA